MNRKKVLIRLIIITLIVITITFVTIKIVTNAKQFEIPLDEEELSKEEYNEQRRKEKEDWIKNNKSESLTNTFAENNNTLVDELITPYEEMNNKLDNEANKMQEIIDRFYSEEYKKLSAEMNKNVDNMSYNELCKQEYTKKIFDLIIDIIKNKEITIEEKELLKEFLHEQYYFIEDDYYTKLKFDEVLAE